MVNTWKMKQQPLQRPGSNNENCLNVVWRNGFLDAELQKIRINALNEYLRKIPNDYKL